MRPWMLFAVLMVAIVSSAWGAAGPFDIDVQVATGLDDEADVEIARLIQIEVGRMVYLTASQKKAAATDPPMHRLQIRYTGEVRTGDLESKPAARDDKPPAYCIAFETRGKLACSLLANQGDEPETLQAWDGDYVDAQVLELGRSKQEMSHIRKMARQAVIARLVLEISRVVSASAAERWWPVQLRDTAPDKDGTVTGTLVLRNQSPWPLDFTAQVLGEVVNPRKPPKAGWRYLFFYPKQTFKKETIQPGDKIERAFSLFLKKATPTQIATGRVYDTEYGDFAFRAALKRVAWNSQLSPMVAGLEADADPDDDPEHGAGDAGELVTDDEGDAAPQEE